MIQLHRHGEYSLLDGQGNADEWVERAIEIEQKALAQTDHGNLAGALHFIKACSGKDDKGKQYRPAIMPILGVEAYFKPDRADRTNRSPWHQLLLAKNLAGWKNLLRLTSKAFEDNEKSDGGFYQRPCADWDLLERHSEGLIATSSCIKGFVHHWIEQGDERMAKATLKEMLRIFGDDYYIEIQPHDFDAQREVNLEVVKMAHDHGVPVIATCDCHYPTADWADTYEVAKLLKTGSSFKKREEKQKGKHEDEAEDVFTKKIETLYLMDEGEVRDTFKEFHPDLDSDIVDESIKNTHVLTGTIVPFVLDKSDKLPQVVKSADEADQMIDDWIVDGLNRLEKLWAEDGLTPEEIADRRQNVYVSRVEEELAILRSKGVIDYFLLVGDAVRWARTQGIRVGLGRGSAAGCLVSYLIGIVNIDPIAYGLLFERFMNPDRKGLPDIDIDFDSERRDEVKEYLAEKYGADHVADVIAHQTFKPRAVIEDVARVFDMDYMEVRKLNETIQIRPDDDEQSLEAIRPLNPELDAFAGRHADAWPHMLRLEGKIRNTSKHASAVLITKKPVTEYVPLERPKKGGMVTSWGGSASFNIMEEYGFMKLDMLGLIQLARIQYALDTIKESKGKIIEPDDFRALRDPYAVDDNVCEAFTNGLTLGVFQFGGGSMTNLIKHIKPENALDLAAANALHRPGAMGVAFEYGDRKANPFLVSYWHESVEPFLKETYGIVAYQEQVMQVVKELGNFTPGQADDMRKAIGKLYRLPGDQARKFMQRYRQQWEDGCEANGLAEHVMNDIWDKILEFSGYGFNKSHAACYALMAYIDMWLKVNYPTAFYAAMMTFEKDEDQRLAAIREARLLDVEVSLPNVNKSGVGFTVVEDTILYGLKAVKNVADKTAQKIIDNRPYTSVEDFTEKKAGNKKAQASLLLAGGFDEFGARDEFTEAEMAEGEQEVLGTTLTGGAIVQKYASLIEERIWSEEEFEKMPGKNELPKEDWHLAGVMIGGEVVSVKHTKVKKEGAYKGRPMAFFEVGYNMDKYRCVLFPDAYDKFKDLLKSGAVLVSGIKDGKGGRASVIVNEMCDVATLAHQLREDEE